MPRFLPFFLCCCLLCPPRPAPALEILAAGDITPAGRMLARLPEKLFSDAARQRIDLAGLFVWNCETSGLSERSKNNTFIFHADGRLFPLLRFDNGVAVTANNHVFDGFEEGAAHLLDLLDAHGLRHHGVHRRGAYNALPVHSPWGSRIWLLSGSPMSQSGSGPTLVTLAYPALLDALRTLRQTDAQSVIVLYLHDGTERVPDPTPRQITWANRFAQAGADVVLFAHSHCYGPFEVLEQTPRRTFVAWGLGNFLFGGHASWKNRRDVRLLSITIDPHTGVKEGRWLFGHTRDWQFSLLHEENSR